MVSLGYALLSEEHGAPDLVRQARGAEEAGFSFALISDHFHPWTDSQGQSAFVWSSLGAIAQATERLIVGTGVTCPTIRIHPAIIAQAAATMGTLMPGRFFLGLGSGENLNEHVLGDKWPPIAERQERLEEAIEVIRLLWEGGTQSHEGAYYTVEDARIYSLPESLPPIFIGAGGPQSARMAGSLADGLIATAPNDELIEAYRNAGGDGPRVGMMHLCWGESEDDARRMVLDRWPNSLLKGQVGLELRLPRDFEDAAAYLRPEDVGEEIPCGPDPQGVISQIQKFIDAGYDHVFLHNIGPVDHQFRFFEFYQQEIAPHFKPKAADPRLGRVAA